MDKVRYFYERINDKDIVFREFNGELTVDEIIDSFNYLLSKNKISDHCVGIITDTSNASLKMSLSEFKKVLSFINNNRKIRSLKLALIVDTPENTIFPILAERKLPNIKIRPFYRKESALKWIIK